MECDLSFLCKFFLAVRPRQGRGLGRRGFAPETSECTKQRPESVPGPLRTWDTHPGHNPSDTSIFRDTPSKTSVGHTPKGSHSPRGRSRHLLETPFSEPLLRALLRTLLYCKTHSRPPSQNPSENGSPEPFPEPSQNPS